MLDSSNLQSRYLELIDQIVQTTLRGMIRSKEQVYQMLVEGVDSGTGEIFEFCLEDRLSRTQQQIADPANESKQAKAVRSLRALQTIQGEWQRWQAQNQTSQVLGAAVDRIIRADTTDRLKVFLQVVDPNHSQALSLNQLQQLATLLQQQRQTAVGLENLLTENLSTELEVEQICKLHQGLVLGVESWLQLEPHLVGWVYEGTNRLGFEGTSRQHDPWTYWAEQVGNPLLKTLFRTLALDHPLDNWVTQNTIDLAAFIQLVVVLRYLQSGLVSWFDKLIYDAKVGSKLSASTFLAFAVIWSQLASGFRETSYLYSSGFVDACFQITLQILRIFSQRDYFPLYGGVFVSFSGEYLGNALGYLDEPLRREEGTQEKARLLTLLGYSERARGRVKQAIDFYQQSLEIARKAGDRLCEIADLNHLSRSFVAQHDYSEAIRYSQEAVVLSRQTGDRLGEANALANLGYSQVFHAQQLEQGDAEVYEMAIDYLQQGLQLAERLGDRQSQALCFVSIGIAQGVLEQHQAAIKYLENGIQAAQISGDTYLQGISLTFLAEAHYHLRNVDQAIYAGHLGMYLLEQISSISWQQPAGLLTILKGQVGETAFQELLGQRRPQIIAIIGVDGYDYLPQLLQKYQS